jgi:hypothetical protein
MGLERGPHTLVSTIEEIFEIKSNGSGLENREYGRRDPSRWPRGTLYPQKLALTSPTSDSRSVGIVRSQTQATEFTFLFYYYYYLIELQMFLPGGSGTTIRHNTQKYTHHTKFHTFFSEYW